jgi:hypothetical protein
LQELIKDDLFTEPGCLPLPSLKNGETHPNYRGAVVKLTCNPGYALFGSSFVYCNGTAWNGTISECRGDVSILELSHCCEVSNQVCIQFSAVRLICVIIVSCQCGWNCGAAAIIFNIALQLLRRWFRRGVTLSHKMCVAGHRTHITTLTGADKISKPHQEMLALDHLLIIHWVQAEAVSGYFNSDIQIMYV